ncbi:MAG: serine/threonine protein kinase [Microcoleus sp. PH2017_01_SCD_O_A]|uniref:serine/threonine-protein kinase n=1 Tax=unclassified Microcoleus TaxID=2642155 RepID=UPI001DF85A28|nr:MULTISPECIES: serine/threonine-protein kinase [unclassified Microcoleus]MCC3431619.1 serine/threonine protein kinase [Microcoleus sp. PH2017_04_SCI_O_A]MCC3506019.1 serine/threonine protein kinase [Microcoleus sp. PH2017_19_SFW_U_A]TAE51076.1 MAG: serine/threonine protein kinase [Oscillatoriales cyanobacterium]MCC3427616.1 serine/threonine protein kinase [Microcoleus sp. PH2017_01_SCD_O_A]MCC3438187.1 serine/threonine protein kinase [Microcoleus sp. PH2017_05_CCC_O_A]
MTNPIYPGITLNNHYRIVRELGHGGFGRTYLAEDAHRFNEPCVLKEFAPQVQGSYALQKSEELFEREAGVLYKLQHNQIPRFREMFRVSIVDRGYLFLVQDYVPGQNYRFLLDARKRQGLRFIEAEINQLLIQILPVLEYIHSLGVIHRDISPDNLILRLSDGMPVLIDFGGVKQIAATVESLFAETEANITPTPATRIGKLGYAPVEQMQMGIVSPHSDLYALAATVLVLLTGKEPHELLDSQTLNWNWRSHCSLSPNLSLVLDKMLAQQPNQRYSSAREVLLALSGNPLLQPQPQPSPQPDLGLTQPPPDYTPLAAPIPVPAPAPKLPGTPVRVATIGNQQKMPAWKMFLFVVAVLSSMGGVGWFAGNYVLNLQSKVQKIPVTPGPKQQQEDALRDRYSRLKIDDRFYNGYVNLVDENFYAKYPELNGRLLKEGDEDRQWRERWQKIGDDLLNKLENLSSDARARLGSYETADLDRSKAEVNKLNLSSRALYDLADAKFFYWFPQHPRNKNIIGLPIGQIWQAITADALASLQAGATLESVEFDRRANNKTLKGNLKPGEGKAYIARFAQNQILSVNLQAPRKSTLLSIYSPGRTNKAKALLEDAEEVSWSGTLDDAGFYEFVVVSQSSEPIAYELNLETK